MRHIKRCQLHGHCPGSHRFLLSDGIGFAQAIENEFYLITPVSKTSMIRP